MTDEAIAILKQVLNPWWRDGKPPREHEQPHRLYYPLLEKLVFQGPVEETMVLTGLRYIGKTHMLKQLAGKAIAEGWYEPRQVVFVSGTCLDLSRIPITTLVRAIEESLVNPKQDWMLLINEVQHFDDWESHLTFLSDHKPRVRCVVSGSSATVLKKKRTTRGVGRLDMLRLPPLLFCEYLQLFTSCWPGDVAPDDPEAMLDAVLSDDQLAGINREFINYLNFGSYPHLAYEYQQGDPASLELAVNRAGRNVVGFYIDRELPDLLGATDISLVHDLCRLLMTSNTKEHSHKKVMEELNANAPTLRKYLAFLEGIYFIRPFRKINERLEYLRRSRTHCQFLLENCSMPALINGPVTADSVDIGQWVEAAALAQFDKEWPFEEYGYLSCQISDKKFEIDLCHLDPQDNPMMLAEIKWSDSAAEFKKVADNMKMLLELWDKEPKPRLYCTSQTSYGQDKCGMRIIPAAQFSAALGMRRIKNAAS